MKNKNNAMSLNCETCQYAKKHRNGYSSNINKLNASLFDLIHFDVWCAPLVSVYGQCYFVIFIDDASRCTWVYLMKSKDEVLEVFKTYHKMRETKFEKKLRTLRFDNGGEYTSKEFLANLLAIGIEVQTSCPYTSEQNGLAAQKNMHLLEVTKALLIEMSVRKSFWSDGVLTVAFLINRMP